MILEIEDRKAVKEKLEMSKKMKSQNFFFDRKCKEDQKSE